MKLLLQELESIGIDTKLVIEQSEQEKILSKKVTFKFPLPDNNSGWVIYGATWCSYCNASVDLFKQKETKVRIFIPKTDNKNNFY